MLNNNRNNRSMSGKAVFVALRSDGEKRHVPKPESDPIHPSLIVAAVLLATYAYLSIYAPVVTDLIIAGGQ